MRGRNSVSPADEVPELQSVGRSSSNNIHRSVLSCHHVSYDVRVRTAKNFFTKVTKRVLKDINCYFPPGMNAILGPTGCGKTSLLNLLAGRKKKKGLTGDLLIDGNRQPRNFKCLAGYVSQDDVIMGSLSVRENIQFSANLRIRKKLSSSEKEQLVDDTIFELGLTNCADSKVGTEFTRGISGGERKRTCVAMELIISPSFLFLDEPTTGLDASTANAVMAVLRSLSLKGRTIIFSIHQPRYSIFEKIDRLLLLSAGRVVYHGPARETIDYFASIGHVCEAHNNPPDFFLDVINGDSTAVHAVKSLSESADESRTVSAGEFCVSLSSSTLILWSPSSSTSSSSASSSSSSSSDSDSIKSYNSTRSRDDDGISLANQLAEKYRTSSWYSKLNESLTPIWNEFNERSLVRFEREVAQYANSFWTQLYYLCQRTIRTITGNPICTVLQIAVMVFIGFVVGGIYWKLNLEYPSGIQNRTGAFFFIVIAQMFGNISAVDMFIRDRIMFLHEHSSGFYRVSSYYLAKIICDTIPMRFLPLVFFAIISYFMMGLRLTSGNFFVYFSCLFMTSMAGSSLGFLIGASINVPAVGNLVFAVVYIVMCTFGGYIVNLTTMLPWISWMQYTSIFRYSLNAFSINELQDQTYYTTTENGTVIQLEEAGNSYLKSQGIPFGTDWDLWLNIQALALITIGMLVFTYVQLRRGTNS